MPAMRAWLSLVGIPNHHAAVAQTTMATKAAHRAISASSAFPPKSTILYMVAATLAFIMVMKNTPIKLKAAAITMALRTPMALVDTHVAMALGSIRPAVYQNHRQGQQNGYGQNRIGYYLLKKDRKRNRHILSSFFKL